MRSALLAAIAAATAAPATAAPEKTHGDVAVVVEVPAWGVAAAAGKLVVIDDKRTTTTAYDATTGARAWQATITHDPRELHTLAVAGASLLEWVADQLHVLDPATGRELAAADMATNGSGCKLDIERGMCALRCPCSYQVVDCTTGARVGKSYQRTYTERFSRTGPPSAGCWGSGSSTIGMVNGLALFSVEDAPTAHDVTAALSVATGKERWRDTFASSSLAGQSGHSPDGKTCWFGGRNGELRVLDCATGKQLWRAAGGSDDSPYAIAGFVAPHGVFALVGARATLYDERTGKVRWRTAFATPTIAWVRGVDQPLDWGNDDATAIALLDPTTGKSIATIALPNVATVTPDGHAGAYIAGDRLAHYSADGKLLGEAAISKPRLVLGTDYLAAVSDSSVAILARSDLHEIGHIDGHFQNVVVEGPLGPRRASLFEYDGKSPGRARILRLGH